MSHRTPSATLEHPSVSPDRPPAGPVRRGWFRSFVLRLHFYAGILVGPFVLVAAVTGTGYAVLPSVERAVYGDLLHVRPADHSLPLAGQIEAADRVVTDPSRLASVRPAAEPGATTRVAYATDDRPEGEFGGTFDTVFVDPATGEVRGRQPMSGEAFPLGEWFRVLHTDLHLGWFGKLYSELAASWLWVVALGGIVLLGYRVRQRRRLAGALYPEPGAQGRRRLRGWHALLGGVALLGMLGLSVTGITWSEHAGKNVGDIRGALDWTAPELDTAAGDGHGGHTSGGHDPAAPVDRAGFDRAVALARAAGIDGSDIEIGRPDGTGQTWTVQEVGKGWPIEADSVAVRLPTDRDRAGRVVDRLSYADDYSLPAKLATIGIQLHTGELFGLVNQLALFVLGLAIIGTVLLGYRMWWRRRPTKADRWGAGRPYPRGSARNAPVGALLLGLGVATGVGILLPLLGISLAAFLLVDAALAYRQRARRRA